MSLVYNIVFTSLIMQYRIAQNFDRGNFDIFDTFQLDRQKFNPSNCLKAIQHLQVYGERQ